jgi:ankyrin repeat protein
MNSKGETPLHLACENGLIACVKVLLDGGADIETTSYKGWTPLFYAINGNRTGVVALLLERGAKIDSPAHEGDWTPIFFATLFNSAQILDMMLEHPTCPGPNLERIYERHGKFRGTVLQFAVEQLYTDSVKILIQYGADINARSIVHKRTPLHTALYMGDLEIANLLASEGASMDCTLEEKLYIIKCYEKRRKQVLGILDLSEKVSAAKKTAVATASIGWHPALGFSSLSLMDKFLMKDVLSICK